MKLIDADKLKEDIKNLQFGDIVNADYFKNAMLRVITYATDEVLLSCPKCHGKGREYRVPIVEANGEYTGQYELCKCLICHGTGKITIEAYEDIQKASREK